MKNQALFSSKDKSKKLKCHLLQFLFGALIRKRNRFRYKKYLVTFLRDCSMKLHKSILKFRLNKLK